MKALGIDIGTKRCWIAYHREDIAFPLKVVMRWELIRFLKKQIEIQGIDTIVVWIPYGMKREETCMGQKVYKIVETFHYFFPNIGIVGVDERFSSKEVQQNSLNLFLKKHSLYDHLVATLLLQRYLDAYFYGNKKGIFIFYGNI